MQYNHSSRTANGQAGSSPAGKAARRTAVGLSSGHGQSSPPGSSSRSARVPTTLVRFYSCTTITLNALKHLRGCRCRSRSTAACCPAAIAPPLRSALYNWPAKIEHWPTNSNGFLLVKLGTVQNTAVFSDTYLTFENRSANAQFWPANCKVHSSGRGVPASDRRG